ncbi:Uncharacterized protein SCF082_LOCUS6813 [Durusdinium trenchii]|uniref:Uncharacterized protein n=1 Tax=Durusdinium trenchii TaxID=1381693 RepID=A0ABP0IIH7_9DINO
MEGFHMLTAFAMVWAPAHLCLTKTDWADMKSWTGSILRELIGTKPCGNGSAADERVEEAMEKLRQRNYQSFSRCLSHLDFVIGFFFFYDATTKPGLDTISLFVACILAYSQHLMVGKNLVNLTPSRLKFFSYLLHLLTLLALLGTPWSESAFKFSLMQSFVTAVRFCLALCFLDPWVSIPFQALYTAADLLISASFFQVSGSEWGALCWGKLFVLVESIAASVFVDLVFRAHIHAVLDSADAESLVGSFRRMLRGISDGEVLLDSQMKVAQESECLKHLILTDVSLKGRSFKNLLAEEEHRFCEFIEASSKVDHGTSGPPLCLRVSLRGAAGIRVAADLYHVAIPGLFGAKCPYHLLAFIEDTDSRPAPDAQEDALPAVLVDPWSQSPRGLHQVLGDAERSVRSGSTGGSCAPMCPELQDMFLLVDVASKHHDVEQVELNFQRQEPQDSQDLASALHSGMPSLRKLVKPTDWETIRVRVARFAEKSFRHPEMQKAIKGMTVKLPGQSGWLRVDEATLYGKDHGKVWLHLRGFHPEKAKLFSQASAPFSLGGHLPQMQSELVR